MQQDYDSSASGYMVDSFEGISQTFSDVEILHTSEVNVVAKAKRYGRWWLLKGLKKEVASEVAYQQRLRKELELLMELQHPAVVSVSGLETVEPLGECIVMEYVDGCTMKECLKSHQNRQDRKRILRELIDAVNYIHTKGVVHRDLKPENIIITHNGENVKLIDFGLADTDSYSVLKQPAGTPQYMSPEQKQTAKADVRNDIYSLGVIMQKMNLGILYHNIIIRCMAPIDQRYQNTKELLHGIACVEMGRKIAWIIGSCLLVLLVGTLLAKGLTTKSVSEADAIKKGKQFISERVSQTGMNEHMDTLTSVIYLRQDFGAVIESSNSWVEEYIQTLKGNYSPEEISEIESALYHETGIITDKWGKKIIQLKNEYDSRFVP